MFIPCCTNPELKFDFYFWFTARCLCFAPPVVLAAEDMLVLVDAMCCWASFRAHSRSSWRVVL